MPTAKKPPFQRTTCACADCVQCCKDQPGCLIPGDLEKIAEHLGKTPEDAKAYFWASPGAVVMDVVRGEIFRVGAITPRRENGRCVFLDNNDYCKIHAVAPAGCAFFDTHMPVMEGQTRAHWMIREQLDPEYQALRDTLPPATSYQPRHAI